MCLGRILSSWESLGETLLVSVIRMHMWILWILLWYVRLEGNVMFILIIFTLHTHSYPGPSLFLCIYITLFCTLSSADISQESCLGNVVNWNTIQCQIFNFTKVIFLFKLEKTGVYDSALNSKSCILLPVAILSKITHLTIISFNQMKHASAFWKILMTNQRKPFHAFMSTLPSGLTMMCIHILFFTNIFN